MNIHYFSSEAWEEAYVRDKLPGDDIAFHRGTLQTNADVADPEAEVVSLFMDSHVGTAELARFPKLKLIATRSTGFDHIDLAAAEKRGVAVANVPFYGENTVAEFAFALILALSRRVIDADERVRGLGAFSHEDLRGFDLAGKTLGVVGVGHIGVHVVRMGRGFGMNVLGFDLHRDEAFAKRLDFTYATLDELLAASDVISLHVPYNAHTRHLINRGNIGKIKKGAYLVNTARGAVVETEALIEGLRSGALAGAGLDVLEEEGELSDELALLSAPHPNEEALKTALANHYLIAHPRVIVTPHVAFNTTEAVMRIIDTSIGNIQTFRAGAPANLVRGS